MNCPHCRTAYDDSVARCPQCGLENRNVRGTYQTSTVLISGRSGERIFRSVEEVPAALRTRLLKSTNGANSATILIADRRGRQEIARAMRNLPGTAQRRLLRAMAGEEEPTGLLAWLTPARRKAVLAILSLLTIAAVAMVFTRFG
jgi:hypothetical protein